MSGDVVPINSNVRRPKPAADAKSADLEYEALRRAEIYAIYGRQWDEFPKSRRGRGA